MYIRSTVPQDFISIDISKEDLREAKAGGHEPNFPLASDCVTLDYMGIPLAIGGNEGNRVWFVTDSIVARLSPKERLQFRSVIMKYRDKLLEKYDTLWNYVWTGNHSHIKFLKSIGAVFPANGCVEGLDFILFTIGRS